MIIANPKYDVVFTYLFEDEKAARLVLSALLGREVLELHLRPTERRPGSSRSGFVPILVLRMEFTAKVQMEDGSHNQVLIEILKAQSPRDVQRYRRFACAEVAAPRILHLDAEGKRWELPVVTVYFLLEGLDNVDGPVLKVRTIPDIHRGDAGSRHFNGLDVATGSDLWSADPFMATLTHGTIVVQCNRLKDRRRTELERLLEVFDASLASRMQPHEVDILEEAFPERYREVLFRLMRAGAERAIREKMDLDDDLLSTFRDMGRERADLLQAIDERDLMIEAENRLIADRDRRMATD